MAEPWEMTREEWQREFTRLDPQFVGWDGGGNRSNVKAVCGRIEHKQRLKMGLPDIWDPTVFEFRPARHFDVVAHAISLGLPVPSHVLDEYLDLAALAAATPGRDSVDYADVAALAGEATP